MSVDATRALELAELAELTSDELERRAAKLIKQARDLRREAGVLHDLAEERPAVSAQRVVTRGGAVVDERSAIDAAKELGRFSRASLQARLGLAPAQTSKVLKWLLEHKPSPIVARETDGTYAYLEPPAGPAERPRRTPPEQMARDESVKRGVPVGRSAEQRAKRHERTKRALSTPGQRHKIRQRDRRSEQLEAARKKKQA